MWNFVINFCEKVLNNNDIERGSYNDGHLIPEEKALAIGDRLQELIDKGEVDKYQKEYEQEISSLPDDKCDLCSGTGTRNDEHTEYKDMKCNKCDGKGHHRPWAVNYPFDKENVQSFAHFCKTSGGFRIC